jgi:hypothetical protein
MKKPRNTIMRILTIAFVSLTFLTSCASSGEPGSGDALRESSMSPLERAQWCHDYSLDLGCNR